MIADFELERRLWQLSVVRTGRAGTRRQPLTRISPSGTFWGFLYLSGGFSVGPSEYLAQSALPDSRSVRNGAECDYRARAIRILYAVHAASKNVHATQSTCMACMHACCIVMNIHTAYRTYRYRMHIYTRSRPVCSRNKSPTPSV